jgi:hypothetical protein
MGLPVAGQYTGKLDDGGEQVRVSNILGTALIEFTYDNLAPWPVEAAGSGASLVLTAPGVGPEHNDSSSWAASGVAGGTPGQENVISFAYSLAAQVTTTVEFSRGLELWDSGPGFTAHCAHHISWRRNRHRHLAQCHASVVR